MSGLLDGYPLNGAWHPPRLPVGALDGIASVCCVEDPGIWNLDFSRRLPQAFQIRYSEGLKAPIFGFANRRPGHKWIDTLEPSIRY